MLFTLKSCRLFAAFVTLFLLVVQAAAVNPPTPRTQPRKSRNNTGENLRKNVKVQGHQAALQAEAVKTHLAAKKAHNELHAVNIEMSHWHQHYAATVPQPHKSNHLKAAQTHQAKAADHQAVADAHHIDAQHVGSAERSDKDFTHSANTAKHSIQEAHTAQHHAAFLKTLMIAANEHNTASHAHNAAAYHAQVLPLIAHSHHIRKMDHASKAAGFAHLALNHVDRPYAEHTVAQGIRFAQTSAAEAHQSKQSADFSSTLFQPVLPNYSQRQ